MKITERADIVPVISEKEILYSFKLFRFDLHDQWINTDAKLEELSHKFYMYGNVFILRIEGETKGFCAFYANDAETWTAYLSIIVVARGVQGTGCGSMLLAEMIDFCKQKGMEKLRLEVSDSNARAIRFYKARGFSLEKHLDVSSHYIRNIGTEAGNYGK